MCTIMVDIITKIVNFTKRVTKKKIYKMKEMGYRSMEYTKVKQQMNDIVGDNVRKLAQLFPATVKDGEVDFEALKEELGQFKEVGSEKYELTWAGKKNAKKIAQGRCCRKNIEVYT